jgi:hypothetical protein
MPRGGSASASFLVERGGFIARAEMFAGRVYKEAHLNVSGFLQLAQVGVEIAFFFSLFLRLISSSFPCIRNEHPPERL